MTLRSILAAETSIKPPISRAHFANGKDRCGFDTGVVVVNVVLVWP